MPDITMCTNKLCPRRKKCYRFTAKPSLLQSYANFEWDADRWKNITTDERIYRKENNDNR